MMPKLRVLPNSRRIPIAIGAVFCAAGTAGVASPAVGALAKQAGGTPPS